MEEKIMTEKRLWSKPELIVLVRSDPEEAVLVGCKTATTVVGGGNQACKKTGKFCIASTAVST